jgi:glycyl-tRNA synthetase beta chain
VSRSLLVEIGTEELPPKALRSLMEALVDGVASGLADARLENGGVQGFATPRRLAVRVTALAERQPDIRTEKLGPAVSAAFTADGAPSPAAQGFARSCGLADPAELLQVATDKGPRLCFRETRPGATAQELIPDLVHTALGNLPIPRRMRWGASRIEFVRPVHWVVLLYGEEPLRADILGIPAGNRTRGHRVHAPSELVLTSADRYESQLREAHVIADFSARREAIAAGVKALAARAGGTAILDPELLDEVTALNEWPVPLVGRFEEHFLAVPREALISSMQEHQKYFPVVAADGALLPVFITVANIDSRRPDLVVAGNERVIRPRFADAAFFYQTDLKTTLAARRERLRTIVYQERLGTLHDKTERLTRLCALLAPQLGADSRHAVRAGELAKSDLVSAMVQEFGELQGTMGRYYARHDGEADAVAEALFEQYLPRHASDTLPVTPAGVTLALADRLDTLTGIFGVGLEPTGSRDPFGLRRASIAILRILIERRLDLDLAPLLVAAAQGHPQFGPPEPLAERVLRYVMGRLRAFSEEQGISPEVFLAVSELGITRPLDLWRRMAAVEAFAQRPEAGSLVATDKRIANLQQQRTRAGPGVDPALFETEAEHALWESLAAVDGRLQESLPRGDYGAALDALRQLGGPVDRFFQDVLVMAEDAALRANRLELLATLRARFMAIADISQLAVRAGVQ